MSKGRKALSKNLKLIQGTHRPDRENSNAPQPEQKQPDMPQGMSRRAKKYWPDLVKLLDDLKIITVSDQSAMELLCETYGEWKNLNYVIQTTYKGKTSYEFATESGGVMIRPLPEIAQRSDAARRFQSMLSEFGLTPAARNKVKMISRDEERDPWADL